MKRLTIYAEWNGANRYVTPCGAPIGHVYRWEGCKLWTATAGGEKHVGNFKTRAAAKRAVERELQRRPK